MAEQLVEHGERRYYRHGEARSEASYVQIEMQRRDGRPFVTINSDSVGVEIG
jgi:hypothetical protein